MNQLKKQFTLKSFSFPLKSQSNLTYYKTLKKGLDLFEDKIIRLKEDDSISSRIISEFENIETSNKKILQIISSYLLGNSGKAYDILEELLESKFYKEKISFLIEKDISFTNGNSKLLRVRVSEEQLLTREEMFHIPFSKRHLVANQRFSIAGLPCLYLGSSIYVCWLELGRKDFGELWVSGYRSQSNFRLLNLAYDLNIIINQLERNEIDKEQFVNYFLLWPLVMASCFQVKYSKAPFHEEYIIPSLLLQWITFKNKNIVGLKYLSTKLENYDNPSYGINYVFPPLEITDEYDFCPKLKNRFKLTQPLSWELMSILPPIDVAICGEGIKAENLEDALLRNYEISRFGYIEKQVFSMASEQVKNPKIVNGLYN
jgi:hypothetical protein